MADLLALVLWSMLAQTQLNITMPCSGAPTIVVTIATPTATPLPSPTRAVYALVLTVAPNATPAAKYRVWRLPLALPTPTLVWDAPAPTPAPDGRVRLILNAVPPQPATFAVSAVDSTGGEGPRSNAVAFSP